MYLRIIVPTIMANIRSITRAFIQVIPINNNSVITRILEIAKKNTRTLICAYFRLNSNIC